jgi:Heterokaryon incompatibility protein (HET)
MPKYEALSYTWGSEDSQNAILLDGKTFLVRDNMWEALIQFRLRDEEHMLWIDAICVNQDNISEQNQQVRIMPHIYTRAQVVLVWLGSPNGIEGMRKTEEERIEKYVWGMIRDEFKEMSTVDYWNRVWIIQEIGKARKIRVHYGSTEVDWDTFISTMRRKSRYNCTLLDCLPLKLADQMLDRYGDGYKLENLLKAHRKALCRDVRDKIYGFMGLANDTYGRLPMNYGKTPFEIWKDVVRFRGADSTISQHDILQFAGLVRDLLGGHHIAATEDIVNEKEKFLRVQDAQDELVRCPARLWGRIACVGPTYTEIRSSLHKVDAWTASLRDHVPDLYLRNAYKENDLFLQFLEDKNPSDLEMVFPIDHPSEYRLDHDRGEAFDIMSNIKPKAPSWGWNCMDKKSSVGNDDEDKRLILLDICPRVDEDFRHEDFLESSKQFRGIGLAPPTARVGDFICYFYQKERAAVVRCEAESCFSIVASAVLADIRAITDKMKNNGDEEIKPKFAVLNNAPLKSSETINLYMDPGSIYEWLF